MSESLVQATLDGVPKLFWSVHEHKPSYLVHLCVAKLWAIDLSQDSFCSWTKRKTQSSKFNVLLQQEMRSLDNDCGKILDLDFENPSMLA